MVTTAQEATARLDLLFLELQHRLQDIRQYDDYYRGKHKLRFASDDFEKFFGERYQGYADNWTAVVADAPTERLQPLGIRPAGQDSEEARRGDSKLWEVWKRNEADVLSDMAWLDAIVAKRSFALVWADEDDEPTITWEHPSQAIVGYDPDTGKPVAGAKLWDNGEDTEYGTLYTPEHIWKFQRPKTVVERGRTKSGIYVVGAVNAKDWLPREGLNEPWPLPNPMQAVPLVEFRNRPRTLGEPHSDISGTVAMQDAINLLWAYAFNAADVASWPQRVIMGADRPVMPVLNEAGEVIGEKPVELEKFSMARVAWIEGENAKIGTWPAANLEQYTKLIEVQVAHVAAQTRTPVHYLVGKMANLSADALKAAETPLVKRTEEKASFFGMGLRELFRLVCLVQGEDEKAKAVKAGEVLWKDIESRSEAQRADALQKKKAIGYPLEYLFELDGLSPTEIERIMKMVEKEREQDPLNAIGAMGETGVPGLSNAGGTAPKPVTEEE